MTHDAQADVHALRTLAGAEFLTTLQREILRDAADEIERLRAVLEDIANSATGDSVVDSVAYQAERALNE